MIINLTRIHSKTEKRKKTLPTPTPISLKKLK